MNRIRPHILLLLWLAIASSGCALSQDQEIQMGREAAPRFEHEYGGLYPSARVQRYVGNVGNQLIAHAERQDLPWQFRVLNSDQINAFALPGGFLYITRGLLLNLDNEAQLAGIMSHEISHVTKRHTSQQIQRQQLFSGGTLLAGLFGGSTVGAVTQLGSGLVLMKYSRGQEQEADLTGLNYMSAAGYNPQGMVQAMDKLESLSKGRGPPEFLSSHPRTQNREEYLAKAVQEKYPQAAQSGRFGREEFVTNVLSGAVDPATAQPAARRARR